MGRMFNLSEERSDNVVVILSGGVKTMNQEDYRPGISNISIIRKLVCNTEKKLIIVDKNAHNTNGSCHKNYAMKNPETKIPAGRIYSHQRMHNLGLKNQSNLNSNTI